MVVWGFTENEESTRKVQSVERRQDRAEQRVGELNNRIAELERERDSFASAWHLARKHANAGE